MKNIIDNMLNQKSSILSWITGFWGVIMVRLFLDKFVAKTVSPLFDLVMDIHNILFFLLVFLFIWALLSLVLKVKPLKLSYLMLFSSLFIVFPPIFDLIKTHGEVFWSFYLISSPSELLSQYLTFFGNLPSGIVYFGTKIVFISVILLLAVLVFVKTKSFLRSFLMMLLSYSALFFMSAFPSFLAYLGFFIEKKFFLNIKSFEIVEWISDNRFFGIEIKNITHALAYNLNIVYFLLIVAFLFVFFYFSQKSKFREVIKNFRYPQVVYNSGLLVLGCLLGIFIYPESFQLDFFSILGLVALMVGIWLSWKASIIFNDIYDLKIDEITNSKRPLPKKIFTISEYRELGVLCFVLAMLIGFSLHYKIGWLLILYQVLAWFYSVPPFRLKKFPFVATFVSSVASLLIFMIGFILFSPNQDLTGFSWRIFFLLLTTYTLCLPIKDIKDIKGDEKYGVVTIPVILGEEKSRLFLGITFFISYLLSVFFLNEWNLFWWALLFGSIAFWVINNKKIVSRRLLGWNLGIVFVYGLILIKIVFL